MKKLLLVLLLIVGNLQTQAQESKNSLNKSYAVELSAHNLSKTTKVTKAKTKRKKTINASLSGQMEKGEIYLFELKISALKSDLNNIRIRSEDLVSKGGMGSISGSFLRYGNAPDNTFFSNYAVPFSLKKGEVLTIYCTYEVPVYFTTATFSGKLFVEMDNEPSEEIDLNITVLHGISQSWYDRHRNPK